MSETQNGEDILSLLKDEQQLKEELKKLEKQIYGLETSYLESTSSSGNLVRGWGDLLSRPSSSNRKKRKVAPEDRIFSLSSSTAMMVWKFLVPTHPKNNEQKDRHPDSYRKKKKTSYEEW
jgi:hypothetical protein